MQYPAWKDLSDADKLLEPMDFGRIPVMGFPDTAKVVRCLHFANEERKSCSGLDTFIGEVIIVQV